MARYIRIPYVLSPVALLTRGHAFLQSRIPGWIPAEGNLDTWILEAVSTETAELITIASTLQDDIYRYLGRSILGLAPQNSQTAQGLTTWTMQNDDGYTIPNRTQVYINDADGKPVYFITVGETVVPPGSTVANNVLILALFPGIAASNLGEPGSEVKLVDILSFVTSITLVDTTVGGLDQETDAEYFDKLTSWFKLLTRTPILPQDFSDIAVTIGTAYRAMTLDNYNPADDSFGNERMVAVAAIDSAGEQVDIPTKNLIDSTLQSLRESTFVVNMMNPTYTTVDTSVTVKKKPGFDSPTVQLAVQAALNNYFLPSQWGYPALGPDVAGGLDPHTWVNQPMVRKYEVAQVINDADGVDYIVDPTLRIGIHGGALAEADFTLPGRIPLTRPGTKLVTVT